MLLKEKSHGAACEPEKDEQESLYAPMEGGNLICPVQNPACSLKQPNFAVLTFSSVENRYSGICLEMSSQQGPDFLFFFLWKILRAGRSLSPYLSFSLGIPTTRRDVDLKENRAQLGEAKGDLGSNEKWKYAVE